MKLQKLSLYNFMPYKGDVTIKFPTDETRNTLIIFGDNMRGKTSLLNSIRWVFYNYAYGRHLRPIPLHLMPNKEAALAGDWRMEARIEFEANGSKYDLRRVAEKRDLVAKPERPEDFNVSLHMVKDGAAIPAYEIDLEINKFAPEQVSRFFLFDGELLQEYEELLIEGSDNGKKIKEAIEQALGVPAITNGRLDLYTLLKRAQKRQEQEAANIKGLEGVAERQREQYAKRESLQNDLSNLKERYLEAKRERLELDDELEKYEIVLTQKAELDEHSKRRSSVINDIELKTQLRLELAGKSWRDLLAPKLRLKKAQLDNAQNELMGRLNQRIQTQTKIDQLLKFLSNSICPTCNQQMDLDKREQAEKDLAMLRSEFAKHEDSVEELPKISIQIQNLSKLLSTSVVERMQDIDKDLAKYEHELSRLENRIEELRSEIEGQDTEDMLRKRKRRNSLQAEEAILTRDIEDRESKISKADTELKVLSQRIAEDESKMTTRGTQIANLCQTLFDVFSASIDELRNSLRQKVELKASEAFRSMSTQSAYSGLRINDNYGLTILDNNGDEVPLRSAGAEQIVALSLIDGLSRSGRGSGPVVMDTPFGRLDMKHRKNILEYLPKSASQLVLFVHDGEIRGNDDLASIAHRIGGQYEIREISPSHSTLEMK